MGSKSIQNSRSFLARRSCSYSDNVPRSLAPRQSFSVGQSSLATAVLPPHSVGDGTLRFMHHHHPLSLISLSEVFICAGCKEPGSGKRFSCKVCDFHLHEFCASPPSPIIDHPLHPQHLLVFHAKPKQGGILWPRCNVCGKATKGFTYRCKACGFQMHPCCAKLSVEAKFSCHSHPMRLLPLALTSSSPSAGVEPGFVCGHCKKERSGRVYRCTVCEYHLHAVCAKAMVNGLYEIGVVDVDHKPNKKLGTAAKFASQVVIELVGSLIEGFGEGMGQSLFQKGRQARRLPPPSNTRLS